MGSGIAQLAASRGCVVRLIDVNTELVARGVDAILRRLDRAVEKGRIGPSERNDILQRIRPGDTITNLRDVALAIETVVEDLRTKQDVMRQLDAETSDTATLATNTSSLSITRIAEVVREPARVVGMHFFNPAPVMPLVEVIAGERSGETGINEVVNTAEAWGKTIVRAKDTPGFIVNRVARGFYLEALRLLGDGVAGVDEIDLLVKKHGGFGMGPFELMDLVGLDVNLAVTRSIWQRMGKPPRLAPHEIQEQLVERGHVGRKSGRGFYLYDGQTPVPAYMVDRRSFELTPLLADAMLVFAARGGAISAGSTEQYAFSRILAAVLNEAGHAYSNGVANSKDIDIAMERGLGWPRGPLAWADEIGHRTVRGFLKSTNEVAGDGRFEPSALFAGAA